MRARARREVMSSSGELRYPSLHGRTIVVTGGSDGIGRVAVQKLSAAGANVVMVGRNSAKTAAAAQSIMSATGHRNVTWEIADLTLQRDVRDLAGRLSARLPVIDVLVNNAGAIYSERKVTDEGLERTFALNHLAPFTLSLLLLPELVAASSAGAPSRIILVSSRAHTRGHVDFADLQCERRFRPWRAYDNAKLENMLFMRELARRLGDRGVVVHALHPGVVATRFAAAGNGRWGRAMRWLMNFNSITADEGADTLVWLATADEAIRSTGGYWIERRPKAPSRAAQRDSDATRLWTESERLSGLDANSLIAKALNRPMADTLKVPPHAG